MDCLLGIDIGTTSTKSALFTTEGEVVDIAYQSYSVHYPAENWAEQDPEDWWRALVKTVRAVVLKNKPKVNVKALSLSTQGGCLVMLDEQFRPVTNAVSWLDNRAQEVSDIILSEISEDELYHDCGWAGVKGMTFATTVWVREKMPEIFSKTRYFCSTVDYLNHRLSGKLAIDYTNLALTAFLDLASLDWSDKALSLAGIKRKNVAGIVPSGEIIGRLSQTAAEELGLSRDVLLVSGAHDQYCANIGAGALNTGDCVLSTGTAWVLTLTADRMVFDGSRTIHPCVHVLDDKFGLMTTVSTGGNSLEWFRNTFCPAMDFDVLSAEAKKAEPGCGGLLFIPKSAAGNRKAQLVNIDSMHEFSHFIRAVFEGVAYANKRHIDIFAHEGLPIEKIIMTGGGAGSSVWPQIVADISNIPLGIPQQKESACAGAAMLAGTGAGLFSSVNDAVGSLTGRTKWIAPDKRNVIVYQLLYDLFKCESDHIFQLQ